MEEKNANHACMNEQFFLEFHMARSTCGNGHWQFPSDAWQHRDAAKRNRDGALNSYKKKYKIIHEFTMEVKKNGSKNEIKKNGTEESSFL